MSRDSLLQGCVGRERRQHVKEVEVKTLCISPAHFISLPNFTEVWSAGQHYTQVTWSSVHGRSARLSVIQSTLPILEHPQDPTISVPGPRPDKYSIEINPIPVKGYTVNAVPSTSGGDFWRYTHLILSGPSLPTYVRTFVYTHGKRQANCACAYMT